MSGRYDAIVVGAGPNGLSAAIRLAEAGHSVLVLEAEDRPGGAVKTEALTIPGFLHDTFSGVYPATAASPVFARMPLGEHGLRLVHPPVAMVHLLDESRGAALYRDLDRTAASLDDLTAGDGEAWRRFISPYLKVWPALRRAMLGGFPPVGGSLRTAAGLGLTGSLETARMILQPVSALADELFEGDGAKAWLYGSALHGDVAPDASGSAVFGFYLNLLGHAVGWPVAEGGSGRITAALVSYLNSLSGELRVNAPVERIVAENGRMRGVEVGGEIFEAGVVVCDVTPQGLLGISAHALPDSYKRKMARYRYGPGSLKLDWALSGPAPWSYETARGAGTLHIGGGTRELSEGIATEKLGGLPESPFLLAAQPTVADPSRAPEGCHTLWAYTHVPSGADPASLEGHVERIEAQVERFAPGFRDLIQGRHVLTPADLESRNCNLVGGDVNAGSQAPDQLFFRPLPSLSPYRTPLRGLYIGSAATFPGGAVHGVPGDSAAKAALTDLRLRRVRLA
ncbi:MAG TPA: NAD(P)/FAD-dependent oxidoreductase [Rubrobacteraceae bacterium]|nr:NAD(P)/FAD-dependent oxidoreductase [Rubrobacteraceae bacterium]